MPLPWAAVQRTRLVRPRADRAHSTWDGVAVGAVAPCAVPSMAIRLARWLRLRSLDGDWLRGRRGLVAFPRCARKNMPRMVSDLRSSGGARGRRAACALPRRGSRRVSQEAARSGMRGLFYTWVDEMSGTLRCSSARRRSPGEPALRCTLSAGSSAMQLHRWHWPRLMPPGYPTGNHGCDHLRMTPATGACSWRSFDDA